MDVLMRKDTKVVEKSVEVKFADGIFNITHRNSIVVRIFVSYSEKGNIMHDVNLQFDGRCSLLEDDAGLIWEFFSEDCTPEIAEMVVDLFLYQDVVDYINGLPS